jgi:hypothetical protein
MFNTKLYPVTIDGETRHYLTPVSALAACEDSQTVAVLEPIDSADHDDFDPAFAALALHFGCALEDITSNNDDTIDCACEPGSYRIMTDSEATEALEQTINERIDDTVLPEIPEAYREYFDREAYISDQVDEINASGGRGRELATYDGNEIEVKIDNEYYYIYRVN